MEREYGYAVADDGQLDELLVGNEAGFRKPVFPPVASVSFGSAGVLWVRDERADRVKPLAIVAQEDYLRRICGRYAQLHSDLSPLSAWCHLLAPRFFESLEQLQRHPDLGQMHAAWSGLVVAEAQLLAERALASIRISSCLATQSFAVARAKALWTDASTDTVLKRFDTANRLCRNETVAHRNESRMGRLRASLQPIWDALAAASEESSTSPIANNSQIIIALRGLQHARSAKAQDESRYLAEPLLKVVPEAEPFMRLSGLAPEARLRLFDNLIVGLHQPNSDDNAVLRRNAVALLTGYLATVAAGGAPSLGLLENNAQRFPELTAWAYVVGGIGERVVWTSSFDGLGRLVARELGRPLRIDEPPTCDFALDEAAVVADSQLADPLVHLRIKQARVATVSLFPGVNVSVPLADIGAQDTVRPEPVRRPETPTPSGDAPLAAFADALWPYLRARVADLQSPKVSQRSEPRHGEGHRGRKRRSSGTDSHLPLGGSKK